MPGARNISTKVAIGEALEKLLLTKPLTQITVKEIVDECQLTRQTFYRNFKDIYELIIWFHNYQSKGLDIFTESRDFIGGMIANFEAMEKRKKFYKEIVKENGPNSFADSFLQTRLDYAQKFIGKGRLNDELSFILRFYWVGMTSMMIEWAKNDMKISPKLLARYFHNCLPPALKRFYE